MRSRGFIAIAWAIASLACAGCASLGGAARTSPEQILTRTEHVDRTLTAEREAAGERVPASETLRLARTPLQRMRVTSAFRAKNRRDHQGIDLDARRGTPIVAADAGIVVHAGEGMRGYGLTVVVRHGRRLSTLYAHADEIIVTVGERVAAGQTLGYVGSTGNASGPHLHFEVRRDTAAVDPQKHLPK